MKSLHRPRAAVLFLSLVLAAIAPGATQPKPTLLDLAKKKFAPRSLTEAEEKLFVDTENGDMASMLSGNGQADDPADAKNWPSNRTLYATSLAWLCTDPEALTRVTHRGIQISGMRILGDLNFSDVKITFPFIAKNCSFEGDVLLMDAQLRSLAMECCLLQKLDAARARFDGVVLLYERCRANGPVSFFEATISGTLNCEGAHFRQGLSANWAKIGSEVLLNNGFKGEGGVNFSGATIAGDLRCDESLFSNPGGQALLATGAKIDGALVFYQSTADGELNFAGAQVGHDVNLDGSRISNPKATACNGGGAKIGGNLFGRTGFEAAGEVNLIGSTIDGNLELDGARISKPRATALQAERVKVGGHVFLRPDETSAVPFRADGAVSLFGAVIGGSLFCRDARLTNQGRNALLADGCKVSGNVHLRDGFTADGTVDFGGAIVEDTFFWVGVTVLDTTVLRLESAKLGTLHGQKETWPKKGNLYVDGLVYNRIQDQTPTVGADRRKWLGRQPAELVLTQPYEQLAAVLRNMGREGEAAAVMVAKNRRQQKFTQPLTAEWFWYNCFGSLIGYGYQPWRPFFMSIGLIIFGAVLFRLGHRAGIVVSTKESGFASDPLSGEKAPANRGLDSQNGPKFSAIIFSLESFTPLLRLDQSANWTPNAYRGKRFGLGKFGSITVGGLLRAYLWFHIIAGWVLTSLWVGSITGLVKT